MTKSAVLSVPQNVNRGYVLIQNSTGNCGTLLVNTLITTQPANTQSLYTAGGNDSILNGLWACSDDTSARVLGFWRYDGTNYVYLFGCNIPANSGNTSGTAMVDILGAAVTIGLPLDPSGRPFIPLKANDQVFVGSQSTVTSAHFLVVNAVGQDY